MCARVIEYVSVAMNLFFFKWSYSVVSCFYSYDICITQAHPTIHTHACAKLHLNENAGGKLFYSTTVMVITIIYVEHISIYKKEHLINWRCQAYICGGIVCKTAYIFDSFPVNFTDHIINCVMFSPWSPRAHLILGSKPSRIKLKTMKLVFAVFFGKERSI